MSQPPENEPLEPIVSIDQEILTSLDSHGASFFTQAEEHSDQLVDEIDQWRRQKRIEDGRTFSLPEAIYMVGTLKLRDQLSLRMRREGQGRPAEYYLLGVVGVGSQISTAIRALVGNIKDSPGYRALNAFSPTETEENLAIVSTEHALAESAIIADGTAFSLIDGYLDQLKSDPSTNPYEIKGAEMAVKIYKTLWPLAEQLPPLPKS